LEFPPPSRPTVSNLIPHTYISYMIINLLLYDNSSCTFVISAPPAQNRCLAWNIFPKANLLGRIRRIKSVLELTVPTGGDG